MGIPNNPSPPSDPPVVSRSGEVERAPNFSVGHWFPGDINSYVVLMNGRAVGDARWLKHEADRCAEWLAIAWGELQAEAVERIRTDADYAGSGAPRTVNDEARDQGSSSSDKPLPLSPDLLKGIIEDMRRWLYEPDVWEPQEHIIQWADRLSSLLGSVKVALSPDLLREIEDACAALMHMEIRINSGIADDADGAGCCTVRSLLRRLAALLGSPHE